MSEPNQELKISISGVLDPSLQAAFVKSAKLTKQLALEAKNINKALGVEFQAASKRSAESPTLLEKGLGTVNEQVKLAVANPRF